MKIWEALEGKKLYIVGILTILWGVIGLIIQKLEFNQAIEVILVGLGMIGLKSALTKIE